MYKRLTALLPALLLPAVLAGCGASAAAASGAATAASAEIAQTAETTETAASAAQEPPEQEDTAMTQLALSVNGETYTVTLAGNEAAAQFAALLPLTLTLDELNGNEKYAYLDTPLPTDAYTPGSIHTGDLMLFGSSCLVLFYEDFSSGYSYTRLGTVDDAAGLAEAVGSGSVTVTFQAAAG